MFVKTFVAEEREEARYAILSCIQKPPSPLEEEG